MAFDKVIDSSKLESELTATADAIREKSGETSAIQWADSLGFANAIKDLPTSGGYSFTKVGEMTVTYTTSTLALTDLEDYQNLTVDDFYLVPLNFIVFHTGGDASGNITCGTYAFKKSYNASTGKFTASRASVSGQVGIKFDCEVYILRAL